MKRQEINQLIERFNAGKATESEIALLESWYLSYHEPEPYELDIEMRSSDLEAVLLKLEAPQQPVRKRIWPRFAIAASLLISLSFGLYLYNINKAPLSLEQAAIENGIKPGSNKAYLTLADGTKIELTDAKNGEVAQVSGIRITKTADGTIVYTAVDEGSASSSSLNTFETPMGGQYQLQLPDGSKVWLNAASSLTYPSSFAALGERKVSLRGEAYFEISKDPNKPFIVQTKEQEVKVLGTHFNINAYETAAKTTLVEGSVKVYSGAQEKMLEPGQQSTVQANQIAVQSADLYQVMAWKNGDFVFEGASLASIMDQISRWYDVELKYEGQIADLKFSGSISRTKNINEVLRALEMTKGVHFEIEGRRILVMP